MIVSPSSMQPSTSPRISSSVSGIQHDERIFNAPVGGVGHVRHAREPVERDVVLVGVAREQAPRTLAHVRGRDERHREAVDGRVGGGDQSCDLGVALDVAPRRRADPRRVPLWGRHRRCRRGHPGDSPLLDFAQPVAHRLDQQHLPLRIVEKVVLQIRIAVDDPDVAQHFEQHPRRTPGTPLAAQFASSCHMSAPSRRMTISRSENDV